jgi:UDP-N-acetyl-D-glucosamine dehydrogenase
MKLAEELTFSITRKQARIGVVGLGYVGLPLLLRFHEQGFPVTGLDKNTEVVKKLNEGLSTIKHISDHKIDEFIQSRNCNITSDIEDSADCDVIIICLPTPLDAQDLPDLSYIQNFLISVKEHLRHGQLISLESTTYPGTTEEIIVSALEEYGFEIGEDIFVSYSPEREDPGNLNFTTSTIPKLCSGHTAACKSVAKILYESVINSVVMVESTKVAEMAKLLENTYRAVNVGLINEMRIIASALEVDIYEVIDAAATKPFGFTPYYPGPGLGGHCLPIDPLYLSWKAEQIGIQSDFIKLAAKVNRSVPQQVVDCLEKAFKKRGEEIEEKKILVLGLAYKKNIDDARESPSYEIMALLQKKGANIDYSDPYLVTFPWTRKFKFTNNSVDITKENLNSYDAVILATDHDNFDLELIQRESLILVDTRGVCDKSLENVERL